MIDTLKTTGVGISGFYVSLMEWLPEMVSLGVGVLTIVYLMVKIRNESQKEK